MTTTTTRTTTTTTNGKQRMVTLNVEGMMCQRNCGTTVENALLQVPGVLQAKASFATSQAWARLDADSPSTGDDLVEAIEDVGFEASLLLLSEPSSRRVYMQVEGMMCQRNCGSTVGNALRQVPGVLRAEASFDNAQAWVEIAADDDYERLLEEVLDAVECVGFDAFVISEEEAFSQQQQQKKQPQKMHQTTKERQKSAQQQEEASPLSNEANVIVLSVEGMSCAACTGRVERSILQVPGVTTAFVSLSTLRAEVGYNPQSSAESLALDCQEAVSRAGYPCDILSAGNGSTMTLQDNAKSLEDAKNSELKTWRNLLLLALGLLIPMMYFQNKVMHYMQDSNTHHITSTAFASPEIPTAPHHDYHLSTPMGRCTMAVAILSTLIQSLVGYRFYKAAWKAGRDFGMDFLVVLGTSASYFYSLLVWFWLLAEAHTQVAPDNSQLQPTFQTGAMLLTFVTFGKFLEAYAKGQTTSALEALMKLQPLWASRVVSGLDGFDNNDDNNDNNNNHHERDSEDDHDEITINLSALETEEISSWDVQIGDHLRVLPGARVPADGVVVALSSTSQGTSKSISSDMSDNSSKAVAYIDESAFSGEPFPVPKGVGDSVYGSSVNQLTVLVIRVTATGSNSVLAKIVRLMEDAQRNKAPIQALADRIASVFAPAVMGLAFLTFCLWVMLDSEAETTQERFFLAFLTSVAVVVVACPCALGLATPTAVMVGTGVGATHGLLIKGGQVLEEMQAIDTIVFDKTGTLTTGRAALGKQREFVTDLDDPLLRHAPSKVLKASKKENGNDTSHSLCLWLAACAEQQSEHPLAKAIVNAAKGMWGGDVTCSHEGVTVDNFFIQPGSGVECVVSRPRWGTYNVRVGNKHWAQEPVDVNGKSISDELPDSSESSEMSQLREMGQVGVYVSVLQTEQGTPDLLESSQLVSSPPKNERRVIGILGVVDPIEAEARTTVAALQRLGIEVWMCTGDHQVTARAVASHIGIDEANVCAGVKPEQKAELITELQSRRGWNSHVVRRRSHGTSDGASSRVAFVGDGINDAVALARANVGVAIGAGTEVAVEAADIVLVRSSLHDVVMALHLSKVVFRRIRMNFVWAMGYNLFALPFAAGILYPFTNFRLPPEYAGLMMAFSSVSVVTSSLLLRNYERPTILEDGTLQGGGGILQKLLHPFEGRARSGGLDRYYYDSLKVEASPTDETAGSSFEMV